MGKILDPIIMNPEKDSLAKPYNKKDIQAIAYEVLADLGDEVINEAIASGKIVIPQNIDVASLPQIEADVDSLTSEQVEQVKGKCWFTTSMGTVCYPCYSIDDMVAWFCYDGSTFFFTVYHKVDDEWQYIDDESGNYNFSSFGTAKLYRHGIDYIDSNGDEIILEIISDYPVPFTASTFRIIDGIGSGFEFVVLNGKDIDDSGTLQNAFKIITWNNSIQDATKRVLIVGLGSLDSSEQMNAYKYGFAYESDFSDTVTEL